MRGCIFTCVEPQEKLGSTQHLSFTETWAEYDPLVPSHSLHLVGQPRGSGWAAGKGCPLEKARATKTYWKQETKNRVVFS